MNHRGLVGNSSPSFTEELSIAVRRGIVFGDPPQIFRRLSYWPYTSFPLPLRVPAMTAFEKPCRNIFTFSRTRYSPAK